jgi:choline kinase
MLDARVPAGGWKEEERKREEAAEREVNRLLEETRLWRVANSAQWVAWGLVQATVRGVVGSGSGGGGEGGGEGVSGDRDGEVKGVNGAGERVSAATVAGKTEGTDDDGEEEEEEDFDYLSYAQDRAYFFLGDCVRMGLIKAEELGEETRARIKLGDYYVAVGVSRCVGRVVGSGCRRG